MELSKNININGYNHIKYDSIKISKKEMIEKSKIFYE